jgi:hypothetical protein
MTENPGHAAMLAEMRARRAAPAPPLAELEPMTEAMARLLGCDTPAGRASYAHLCAWRGAGYDGPLDRDGAIPDPDDPATIEAVRILAALRAAGR